MSYAVTDAVESDARAELKALEHLNEEIDQLSSEARGVDTLCPEAKVLLDLAWWFTEDAIRETTGTCSAHSGPGFCACCHHYNELKNRAASVKRVIR